MIGLLSDSHGQAQVTRRAVELLLAQGATTLVHLGDVGTEAVIDALVPPDADIQARLVFGNTDVHTDSLARYARGLGVQVDDPVGRLELAGKTMVYLHGHDPAALGRALAGGPTYLCHGHSHHKRDQRIGATRIINPGALFRASLYTVAVLDARADRLRFLQVDNR